MLAISKKQMMVLMMVLVSFVLALAASMALIHATNPTLWHNLMLLAPFIQQHYS